MDLSSFSKGKGTIAIPVNRILDVMCILFFSGLSVWLWLGKKKKKKVLSFKILYLLLFREYLHIYIFGGKSEKRSANSLLLQCLQDSYSCSCVKEMNHGSPPHLVAFPVYTKFFNKPLKGTFLID